MKQRIKIFSSALFTIVFIAFLTTNVQAELILLDDDFSSGSVVTAFRAYENTIDTGWRKAPGYGSVTVSAWTIAGGVAGNSSTVSGTGYPTTQPSETPLMSFFSGGGTTETQLRLQFDYSVASGDKFYAHLWGFTGTTSAPSGFVSNIEASANGNANVAEGSAGSTLDGFNLADGATNGYGNAANAISGELTGSGTFDVTFSIGGLGISGVTTASDLDYYLIQFAKDEDGTAGTTSIDNFRLSAIPEPTSFVMFGLAIAGLGFRRRIK